MVSDKLEKDYSETLRKLLDGYNKTVSCAISLLSNWYVFFTIQYYSISFQVHVGPVSDPINCDNAWLDATVIYFKITSTSVLFTDLEEVSYTD